MIYYHTRSNEIYLINKIKDGIYIIQFREQFKVALIVDTFDAFMKQLGMVKVGEL